MNDAGLLHALAGEVDEEEDPEIKDAMALAATIAASNGESRFMQAIAAGEAKDAVLASRAQGRSTSQVRAAVVARMIKRPRKEEEEVSFFAEPSDVEDLKCREMGAYHLATPCRNGSIFSPWND